MSEIIKQVIIVRKDLNMRKGKLAAQVAHASMKVFLDNATITETKCTFLRGVSLQSSLNLEVPLTKAMNTWIKGDFTKIVVSVPSLDELLAIHAKAKKAKLPTSLILDIAKTEFKEPTYTCCAIGPIESHKIDSITADLPLL